MYIVTDRRSEQLLYWIFIFPGLYFKRGWTTYTVAAVDNRIIAQAPMVLTCLNFVEVSNNNYFSGNFTYT